MCGGGVPIAKAYGELRGNLQRRAGKGGKIDMEQLNKQFEEAMKREVSEPGRQRRKQVLMKMSVQLLTRGGAGGRSRSREGGSC